MTFCDKPTGQMPPDHMPLGRHFARTVALALPVMAARAGLIIMFSVDAAFCGWSGKAALADFGAAVPLHMMLQIAAVGLLIGTIILTAQADGGGRQLECGRILRSALTLAGGLGLLYVFLLLPAETLLGLLGQPPETLAGGGEALRMLGYSLPGILMFIACSFFLEGINRPLPGMLISLGANFINAGLNWVFVFGHLGSTEMGAAGSALATSITRWLMLGAILAFMLLMRDRARYAIRLGFGFDPAMLRRLLVLGLPLALAVGTEVACFNFAILMAGWLGATDLAVMYATINFTSFVYMLTLGLSTAASVRVGNAIGRSSSVDLRRAGWVATGMALGVMLTVALGTFAGAPILARIYSQDPIVFVPLAASLSLATILFIIDGLQGVLMGALRGAADTLFPTLVYVVSFAIIGLPMGYIFGYRFQFGVPALVWSLIAALTFATIGLGWRFHIISRRPEGFWR